MLDDGTIQVLLGFLEDIQIEAAASDDIILVEFTQDMIDELINSDEVFDNEDEAIDRLKDIELDDYYTNESKRRRSKKGDKNDVPLNMSDEESMRLYNHFSNMFRHFSEEESKNKQPKSNKDKKDKRDKKNKDDENDTVSNEPTIDTNEDKFNKYYSDREYKRQYSDSKSLIKMLGDLGIDIPDKN